MARNASSGTGRMNAAIVFSATIFVCLCITSDAVYVGRRSQSTIRTNVHKPAVPASVIRSINRQKPSAPVFVGTAPRSTNNAPQQRPTIIIIQQDAPRTAAPAALAPVAAATSASQFPVTNVGASKQNLRSITRNMILADILDTPQGYDPVNYEISQQLEVPYVHYRRNTRRGADPIRSLVIADALDLPYYHQAV